MTKTKRVKAIVAKAVDWNDPELSSKIEAGDPFSVQIRDPRFEKAVKRSFKPVVRDDKRWRVRIGQEMNSGSTCAKLLRAYKAVTLDEQVYREKVLPLTSYWSLDPAFEDDTAILSGTGRAISDAFNVLGALTFLGQAKPPLAEELNKVPYVCSIKWALQMQNSFGPHDTIEGLSRAYAIRRYYRILLISEFDLASLNPRIQQALLYLLQDRDAAGLLTVMHVSDYQPSLMRDSGLIDFIKHRVKIV